MFFFCYVLLFVLQILINKNKCNSSLVRPSKYIYKSGKKRRGAGNAAISTIADAPHAHAQVKTYTADNGAAHRPLGAHAHYNKVRARPARLVTSGYCL